MTTFSETFAAMPRKKIGFGTGGFVSEPIECADGFKMSVQASQFHYCSPRDNKGPYTAYEIGFPSEKEEALMPYAEDEDNPTETVYGWVPVAVINAIITKHGGIKE
jgi:hypothetical protein